MKRLIMILSALVLLCGCGQNESSAAESKPEASSVTLPDSAVEGTYRQITQEEAAEMMKRDDGHIIVDVRRQDEYDAGHIPEAVLIPNESISTEPPAELPDKEQIILVYCRSGRRSKEASQKLADMGYKNVYEFGGIITWQGEITTSVS